MLLKGDQIRILCMYRGSVWLPRKNAPVESYIPVESTLVFLGDSGMIEPFSEGVRGGGVISYGLSDAGYDIRLGDSLLVFKNTHNLPVDPKLFYDEDYRKRVYDEVGPAYSTRGRYFTIPPHSYVLGVSVEKFNIPLNIVGTCLGKSTYARSGIIVNVTPLEPGWRGYLTIEISNSTPAPAVIYAGEGIAQILFHLLDGPVEKGYGNKGGSYQDQFGITPAKVNL